MDKHYYSFSRSKRASGFRGLIALGEKREINFELYDGRRVAIMRFRCVWLANSNPFNLPMLDGSSVVLS